MKNTLNYLIYISGKSSLIASHSVFSISIRIGEDINS